MLPQATVGAILCAVRIDFGLPSKINPYPAQPATGVLGQRPKRILPTFVRTKVGPRRVGVQTKITKRLAPPEVIAIYHLKCPRRVGVPTMISKRPAPPSGDNKLFHTPPTCARTHPSTTQNPPAPPISRHSRICVRMRAGAARHPGPRTQATPAENSSPNCEYSLKFTVLLLTNKRSCGTI